MAAHELSSGVAVVPEVGAKFGDRAVSETALAGAVMDRLPADSVVMADAGFGIFAVAWEARRRGLGFVFRLTAQRAKAYRRTAREVASGDGGWTGERVWRPSAKERRAHPEWPADAELVVRMHEVRLPSGGTLTAVTDQTGTATEVGEWYRQRGLVEVDIRNLKVVLDSERMAARMCVTSSMCVAFWAADDSVPPPVPARRAALVGLAMGDVGLELLGDAAAAAAAALAMAADSPTRVMNLLSSRCSRKYVRMVVALYTTMVTTSANCA